MQPRRRSRARSSQAAAYEIKVRGVMSESWSDWFAGLTPALDLDAEGGPITTLTARVPDQAALRGIVNRLWDLNMTLISIWPLAAEPHPEVSHDH